MIHEPADSVVLLGVLESKVEVEQLQDLVDVGAPVDACLVVGQADDHRLLDVVLVLDLADDLLEQVLDRDQSRGPTVLVEHDRDVHLAPLELMKQVIDGHGFGHEHGGP